MQNHIYFFLPDVNGGVASVINNIISYGNPVSGVSVIAYTDKRSKRPAAFFLNTGNVQINKFEYCSFDNLFNYLKKLKDLIKTDDPVFVATDSVELQMADLMKLDNKLVFIVFGDFDHYYALALKHQNIINRFIAISKDIYNNLLLYLPDRKEDITLAYFPTPDVLTTKKLSRNANLRILYVARFEPSKDPLQLPVIDRILKESGVKVNWTIVGSGPLEQIFKETILQSGADNFSLMGMVANDKLHDLYMSQDIFIMTSLSEGLPVSLIEAMKSGLVPVVSNIAGGIREIVVDGKNGFLNKPGEAGDFAKNLINLHENPDLLEQLSQNAISSVKVQFDPYKNSSHYFDLIQSTVFVKGKKKFGHATNRLDKKWIPSFIVRNIRKLKSRLS